MFPLHPCFYSNKWGVFFWLEVVTGSCKTIFPISYLVYSVKYTCLLTTYLVYSVNYLVCLLITTRANQNGEYNYYSLQ